MGSVGVCAQTCVNHPTQHGRLSQAYVETSDKIPSVCVQGMPEHHIVHQNTRGDWGSGYSCLSRSHMGCGGNWDMAMYMSYPNRAAGSALRIALLPLVAWRARKMALKGKCL